MYPKHENMEGGCVIIVQQNALISCDLLDIHGSRTCELWGRTTSMVTSLMNAMGRCGA